MSTDDNLNKAKDEPTMVADDKLAAAAASIDEDLAAEDDSAGDQAPGEAADGDAG